MFGDQEFRQSVRDELIDARELVHQCLSDDERCRNDDRWLMLRVWQKQGLIIMVDFDRWSSLFMPETIRRVRQDIQSSKAGMPGELLPTDPDVLVRRKIKEETIRAFYGGQSRILNDFIVRAYGVK